MTAAMTSPQATQVERLRALAGELTARDRWSREQLVEHQRARLRALVRHAVSASPYYREALGRDAAVGDVPLRGLPTLSKATLMEEFDRVVTDPRLRMANLEAHLAGPEATRPFLGEYRVLSTSGTTGLRGVFVYTGDEFTRWVAPVIRATARMGVTPATRLVGIGAPGTLHLTKQQFAVLQAGREGAPQLSVTTPMPEMVEALNAYRPEALLGYPSVAALLAEEQLEGRLRIEPRLVALGGEVLTEDMRRRVDAAWGVRPFEVYAATEAPVLASSAPGHAGLHLCEDLLVVEVVDERNRPVPPGTPGYKVLVTNLVNHAQPLIRYELSDSVTLADGPDPTGRPYGRIARVDGRSDDILHLPAPAGGEIQVHPYRLRAPFLGFPDVRQYQVLHDRRGLHVRVVLRPSAPRETTASVRAALVRELHAVGAVPPPIEVEAVAAIEREPGHAAKLKLVKIDRPVLAG